jgi:lipoate-protein ligase A
MPCPYTIAIITMRIIDDIGRDAFTNMAVDEAIFCGFLRGEAPPTFRFYTFSPPAISLGYFQKINGIDIEQYKRSGIDVVRRPTGGRAVIHDGDLTISLTGSDDNSMLGGDILETYRKFSEIVAKTLKGLGIEAQLVIHNGPSIKDQGPNKNQGPVSNHQTIKSSVQSTSNKLRNPLCFSSTSKYELVVEGEKVLGCAQVRKEGGFLLQASLNVEEPHRVVMKGNGHSPLPRSLSEILGTKVGIEGIKYIMEEYIGSNWRKSQLTHKQIESTNLFRERFASRDWNYKQ